MSENLDLVRSICAGWESGDFSSTEWAHPEIEYVWPEGPSPGTWTGRRAMGESWREYMNAWQSLRTAVDEYRELDSKRVLVLARFHGRGRTSGLDLGQVGTQGAYLFQIYDGKVTRLVGYWSRDCALADLGLEEQAISQENVEVVRRWFAFLPDLARPDPADDDAILDQASRDYLHAEYEVRLPADYPEGELVFTGREGLYRFAAMLRDAWSDWRFQPERFIDAGDRVVVFMRVVARGRASGAPIERANTQVVTIRGGRMTLTRVYRDRSEALKRRRRGGVRAEDACKRRTGLEPATFGLGSRRSTN